MSASPPASQFDRQSHVQYFYRGRRTRNAIDPDPWRLVLYGFVPRREWVDP